jgi:hypothetical protein
MISGWAKPAELVTFFAASSNNIAPVILRTDKIFSLLKNLSVSIQTKSGASMNAIAVFPIILLISRFVYLLD